MNVYPTPAQFVSWIAQSHKGDRFQYHLGFLLHDRRFKVTSAINGTGIMIDNLPLGDIAAAVIAAYEEGYIVPVQKRLAEDVYQYLAIRTKKYVPAPLMEKVDA